MSVVGAQVRAILRNVSDRERLRMGEVCMPSRQNRFVWLSVAGRVVGKSVRFGLGCAGFKADTSQAHETG